MLSHNQENVLKFMNKNNGEINLRQAEAVIGLHPWVGNKFVIQCMSRMVKRGLIKRVKRGLFHLPNLDEGQLDLWPNGRES